MMKLKKTFCLVLFVGVLICLFGAFNVSYAKKIKLKAGSVWEESLLWNNGFRIFADMVAKESKGELIIEFAGGPETFPTFEGIEFLRKGVIDVLNTSAPFYTPKCPGVFTINLSAMTPDGERKSGYYDALNKLHQKKLNAVYLGRITDAQFVFAFKRNVERADFSGLKIRGLPVYNHIIKTLGGSPIIVAPPELYTALEKGIVEGYGWPELGHMERKFHEVAKYHLDHPYYRVPVMLLMNLDCYNKLPSHLQKLLTDIMPKVEKLSCADNAAIAKKERMALEKSGVKFIKLSPAEAKKFYDVTLNTGIAEAKRLSPDNGPGLIKLLGR